MKWFFSICLTVIFLHASAQSDSTYQLLIAKADLFHLQKDHKKAIPLYESAFLIHKPDELAAYKAAGMFALNGDYTSAFRYLLISISSGWTETDWLIADPYFSSLKKADPLKWKIIVEQARQKERLLEKNIALPAIRKDINLMTLNDQKLRYRRVQVENDSVLRIIDGQINQSDLNNLNRAKMIVTKYGWLKKSDVGKDGQNNLWLIVQHADQDVLFQQKALLAMKQLLGTNEISLENYAFLYDRVQCNLNYKQCTVHR